MWNIDKGAESERCRAVFDEVGKDFGVGCDNGNPFSFVSLFRALIPLTFSIPCVEVRQLRIKRVDCRRDTSGGCRACGRGRGVDGGGDGEGYGSEECRDVSHGEHQIVVVVATVPRGALLLHGSSRLRRIQDHTSAFVVN